MSSVEALMLMPILLTIIILNAAVADVMRGEIQDIQKLKAELERCLGNETMAVNGSLPP